MVHWNYKIVIQARQTDTGGVSVIDLNITDPQQDHGDHDDQHEQFDQPVVGLPRRNIFEAIRNRFHVLVPTGWTTMPTARIIEFSSPIHPGHGPLAGRTG